ncbi:hypothetical protein PHAVU_004G009509 [Phaseolus vulgaris]
MMKNLSKSSGLMLMVDPLISWARVIRQVRLCIQLRALVLVNGQWVNEPCSDFIQKFFRVLAICHTAIPDEDNESGEISYEAESPDEAAFVIAARELGFEFFARTQSSISLHELHYESGKKVDRVYQLLHVLEFSSSRKRTSVIVSDSEE